MSNEETLHELEKVYSRINEQFTHFSLEYANKISGLNIDDVFLGIRSSLLFRLRALIFHYEYLLRHKEQYRSELNQKTHLGVDTHFLADTSVEVQSIIFDDLIFNTVSAFDYLGYFISVLTYGTHKKWNWNKLYRATKQEDSTISNSIFKEKMVEVHSGFIDNMYGFRSDLIHYKAHGLTYGIRQNIHGIKLTINPPLKFLKVLKKANLTEEETEYELLESVEKLLIHCFQVINEILDLSFEHIKENPKRDKSEQIYFFRNSNENK